MDVFYYFIPEWRDDLEEGNEMIKEEMKTSEELRGENARLQEGNL